MSAWLLLSVSALYALSAIDLLMEGNTALSLFCAGCVLANLGLMMAVK